MESKLKAGCENDYLDKNVYQLWEFYTHWQWTSFQIMFSEKSKVTEVWKRNEKNY